MIHILLLFVLAIIQISPSKSEPQQPTADKKASAVQDSPSLTAVPQISLPIDTDSTEKEKESAEQQSKGWPPPPPWDIYWPTAILGLFAAYIAIRTLADLKKQTKTAKDAADAALLNAQAVIEGDRAWILVDNIEGVYIQPAEVQNQKKTAAAVNFKNFGKTIGRIVSWKFGLYITNASDEPPAVAYDTGAGTFHPSVIPQERDVPQIAELQTHTGIITQTDLTNILEEKTQSLWLCGLMRYQDAFRREPEHETLICYKFGHWILNSAPFFKLDGPTKYNRTT